MSSSAQGALLVLKSAGEKAFSKCANYDLLFVAYTWEFFRLTCAGDLQLCWLLHSSFQDFTILLVFEFA